MNGLRDNAFTRSLQQLRTRLTLSGVLLIGSGNIVHNLGPPAQKQVLLRPGKACLRIRPLQLPGPRAGHLHH